MTPSRWIFSWKKALGFSLLPVCLWFPPPAKAQILPYLKSATFYLAADGWVDIWLNGTPIIENQRSTPESVGYQTTVCLPEHICYFQTENILAIENANAYNGPFPLKNQIGMAYILHLRFSDGTELILSSNDVQDHKSYYLPNREAGEPHGWQQPNFNDVGWPAPYSIGTSIPAVALLSGVWKGAEIQFLSAAAASYESSYAGEKHLYRRQFHLDISPNPLCEQSKVKGVEKHYWVASNVLSQQTVRVFPKATPTPTEVPIRKPAYTWEPSLAPTLTSIPTPTWTPIIYPTSIPAFTSTPFPIIKPVRIPTVVPSPIQLIPRRKKLWKATPSPAPEFGVPNRADPIQMAAPPVIPRTPTPTSTPGTAFPGTQGQAQTIVFENQPANIYISYADGPGIYRLEVTDSHGNHVKNLFEKHVVGQQDDWVDWDGTDDSGREMPPASYIVFYTKDGTALNKLILIKTGSP